MTSLLDVNVLILDGGLGTTLEDHYNIIFSSETPLWSSHLLVSSPETLRNVQTKFADAGADMIITATYQASFDGFRRTRTEDFPNGIDVMAAKNFMTSAISIARSSFVGKRGLVALSLGAYGATMIPSTEYSGEYGSLTEEDLFKFHRDRLEVFKEPKVWNAVDIIAIETIPRLDEIRATRRAVQKSLDKPYWISCVFPNDDRLPDGNSIESVVEAMLQGDGKPYAIGINCTKIYKIANLVLRFEAAAQSLKFSLPRLILYPDGAGNQVYDTTLQRWVGDDIEAKTWDEQMIEIVRDIQKRDKWKGLVVGGCCKTTPDHISNLRRKLCTP